MENGKKKNNLGRLVILMLALFFIIGLAVSFFVLYKIYSPANVNDSTQREFVIKEGEGVNQVSARLEAMDLIDDNFYFDMYLWAKGLEGNLVIGVYYLQPDMKVSEIGDLLTSGQAALEGEITFLEGWSREKYAEHYSNYRADHSTSSLSRDELVRQYYQEFMELSAEASAYSDYSFIKDLPAGASLEGFLFPDTYRVYYHTTTEDLIKKMLDNFASKITADLSQEITKQGASLYQIVNLASIVQQEVRKPEEMKMVAGVYKNRLDNNMLLQSDATITYITKKNNPRPSYADTQIDSPYNTYLYVGLPPGPINNPGFDAITAAVYPTAHDYLFFITTLDRGEAIFSKTAEEHAAASEKFLDNQ